MSRSRRLLGTALGLAALAAAAACSSPPGASPAPATTAPGATGAFGTSPPAKPAPPATTTTTTTTAPPPAAGCPDVGTYIVDGADPADVPKGLCLPVGTSLRIENTFPNATAVPSSSATCHYEAGVVVCLLTKPGNVTITWGQGAQQRSTTILVVA